MAMPVKYTCPACTAILKTAEPLPVGKQVKCPRCMRQFPAPAVVGAPVTAPAGGSMAGKTAAAPAARVPAPISKPAPAARETKVASAARQTMLTASAAKPTQLAAPPEPPPPPVAPKLRFPCPKCTGVLKVSTAPPPGKLLKCPRCNAVFPVPGAGAKPPTMLSAAPAPPAAGKASAGGNARATAPKTLLAKPDAAGPPPAPVPKPRPKTMLAKPAATAPPIAPKPVRKTMLAGPPAAAPAPPGPKSKPKTMLSVPSAPPAAPHPKPQTMVGVPAAKTGQTRATAPAPAADKAAARFKYTCPGCKAVIATPTALPAGKAIKCPRCARAFAVPRPAPVASPAALPTKTAAPRKSPPTFIAPAAPPPAAAPRPEPVRLACPGCKAILKLAGMPAPGATVKCPKCARPLRFGAKPAPSGVLVKAPAQARPTPSGVQPAPENAVGLSVRPRRRLGLPVFMGLCGLALLCAVGYSYLAGWWGQDIPASAWVEFAPPGGRCQVLMPGAPVASDPVLLGEGTVSAQKYTVERKNTAAFTLTWADRRAEVSGKLSFNDIYGEISRYLLDTTSGWIQDETDIIVNGQPGKELRILPSEGGTLIARVFLVRGAPHDRVYVLLVAGPRLQPGQGDAARFLDSFKIESAPQPARRERGRIRIAQASGAPLA